MTYVLHVTAHVKKNKTFILVSIFHFREQTITRVAVSSSVTAHVRVRVRTLDAMSSATQLEAWQEICTTKRIDNMHATALRKGPHHHYHFRFHSPDCMCRQCPDGGNTAVTCSGSFAWESHAEGIDENFRRDLLYEYSMLKNHIVKESPSFSARLSVFCRILSRPMCTCVT